MNVGSDSRYATYDPENGYVYVTNLGSNNESIISGTTVVGSVKVGSQPFFENINSTSGYVYVENDAATGNVTVLSGLKSIGSLNGGGGYPQCGAYDTSNGFIYIPNVGAANVSVISGTKFVGSVSYGANVQCATYDGGNGFVYVSGYSGVVGVISGTTLEGKISVGSTAYSLVYDSGNGYVYVVNYGSNTVSVISGTSLVANVNVASNPQWAVYDSANGYVYVCDSGSNQVSVISGTTVVATLNVGSDPYTPAYDSGNGDIYVPNLDSKNVSVISGTSLLGSVAVGNGPFSANYDPGNGYIYVPNSGGTNVTVLIANSVTFTEGGLPSGTSWSVTLNGHTESSTSSTIVFSNVGTGTFPYSVGSVAGYSVSPSSGSIVVSGNAGQNVVFTPKSPHAGTLDVYEVAPGGSQSEDPSVDYETVGFEPIANVYETLIAYNGSSATTFLPVLATCVPGTSQCLRDYGTSLVVDGSGAFAGLPVYWTFVIDPAARFYDPATEASWGVYPSDVMFSISRTCAFADLPGAEINPGWIQCQALLPNGSRPFDSGIHQPFNNTPENVLGSMLVNNSTYCPAAALVDAHGCITFIADGGGRTWPFFLELVTQSLGASVEPCGWFTSESAGIPGWNGTKLSHGDGSCLLPDGGTTTSGATWASYLAGTLPGHPLNSTSWDAFEELAKNSPAVQPNVQWNMVGSGPYYGSVDPHVSYMLKASPAYVQPSGCSGAGGLVAYPLNCDPPTGSYLGNVSVTWENNDSKGVSELGAGVADLAVFSPENTSKLEALANDGLATLTSVEGTGDSYFDPFNLNWSLSNYTREGLPDPSGINIPSDFFSSIAARQLLVQSYPYDSIERNVLTVDGVPYLSEEGGPIPESMTAYYPTNISFPTGVPGTNSATVGGAAWWWAEGTTHPGPANPYYDPELAECLNVTCSFPIVGPAPINDSAITDWIDSIEAITGGAIQPTTFDLGYLQVAFDQLEAKPGAGALPLFSAEWLPDFFDPSDYVHTAVNAFDPGDAVAQQLSEPKFDNTLSCGHSASSFANLIYWANQGELSTSCEGVAFNVTVPWTLAAESEATPSARALTYNLIEHILNELGLFTWTGQANLEVATAPWISTASINTNPVIAGGDDNYWYQLRYNAPNTAPSSVSVGSGPDAVAYDPDNGELYDANFYSNTVNAVNPGTDAVLATIPVGLGPVALAIAATDGFVYVVNVNSGNVTVINATSNKVVTSIAVGSNPLVAAYDPTTQYVYVVNSGSGNVSIINTTSNLLQATAAVGTYPENLAVDSSDGYVFVVNYDSGNVTVIKDTTVVANVSFATGNPRQLAWDPENQEMYVVLAADNAVVVVNAADDKIVDTISMNDPTAIWYITGTPNLYVDNGTGSLFVIDGATNTIVKIIALDPTSLVVDPSNGEIYVADFDSDTVTEISAMANSVIETLPVGSGPAALAIDPVNGDVFVADEDAANVAVIPTLYAVQFSETGLPTGVAWTVTLNGDLQASTGTSITYSEQNGSYSFSLGSVIGYIASPASGSVTTTGSALVETITFTPRPVISVTPAQGPLGALVTVTGAGFSVSAKLKSLTFDSKTISSCKEGSLTAGAQGTFSCSFTVPTGASGTTVKAVDEDGEAATGKFVLTTPKISVSPAKGPVGATVIVSGTGFSVLTPLASLTFDSKAITSCTSGSLTTTATGAFSCTFKVPSGTSGTTVKATDVGGKAATGTFTVTTPKITVSPTTGPVGATVKVSGTGFSVSSTVVLVFDGVTITSCTSGSLKTGTSGSFSCTFKVPSGTSGTTVEATDVGGQVALAKFTVT